MRILAVDDSETVRRTMREALLEAGWPPSDVLEASNGTEALRLLLRLESSVDLVLADWEMPGMGGITLLKTMRLLAPLQGVAVIMVTENVQAAQVKEALQAGARDFLLKPFEPATLVGKVRKIESALRTKKDEDTSIILNAITAAAKSEVTFLTKLPMEVMRRLYKIARSSDHEAGEVLVRPGETVDSLHVVVDGEVEVIELEGEKQGDARRAGDCFGEISFLTGSPATITARARTAVRIASVPKPGFGDLLMDHPELSYHLTRVLARYHARRSTRVASDLTTGISGTLQAMPLSELVQILNQTRKSGLLRLQGAEQAGELYFDGGEVLDARFGSLTGKAAFHALLGWERGKFGFDPAHRRTAPGLGEPTLPLLMEGMRLLDEARKARGPAKRSSR